jgi:ankyrin repeat protein
LLAVEPEQANRRYGEHNATLLHIAAERNDLALAQLALSAHPDLTIKDSTWNAPALGWAHHLQRPGIIALIKSSMLSH